ncbi:type 4 pilus major pilin [Stenotrophomonas maltophilia]|uniref:type 4 pilus major pilin n=1 Tax=Stenotrophomonas maltophilia TaxID=40324 RepID=UPI00066DE7E0|nr:type 4 pilus major pilin [Stenotrophomonas maltophilia]MDH0794619.1 hypothetical protein [Stenotrophomonas maltophilia]
MKIKPTLAARRSRGSLLIGASRQQGATVLEIMAWMAIAALIIGGAIAGIASGWSSYKENKEGDHVTALIANTKKLQSVSGYGASGTNLVPSLIATNGVPGDMTVSGNTLTNRYGGTITVVSTGLGYTVTSPGLPANACIAVAKSVSSAGGVTTKINSGSASTTPVDTVTATAACTSATNSLAFTLAN